jgi:hypothetical protein
MRQVFTTVLEAIGNFDKASKTTTTTPPPPAPTPEPTTNTPKNRRSSPGKLPDNPIEDDDPKIVIVETPASQNEDQDTNVTSNQAPDITSSPCTSKKPSVYARCGRLIKFLFLAQYQQSIKDQLDEDLLLVVSMQPTMELAYKEWSVIRHIQAGVNQTNKTTGDHTSPTDPTHLFIKIATPLNGIKSCLENLADKVGNTTTLSTKTNLQKVEAKFEPPLTDMFLRL